MIRFLIIVLYLSICVTSSAQVSNSFALLKSFKGEVADAAIDNLDNVYLLTTTDQLKKYNSSGDSMAVYNNVRKFGKVYSIDVSNPLKLLLYYKDFSSVAILDRLLAVRSTIDLRQKNILGATAAGLSYDNNIWVFDAFDNKLKKINEGGELLLETPDLRQVFNESINPQQISDRNNYVYMIDSSKGIFVFDYYGTFKRKIPVTGSNAVDIMDKYIMGVSKAGIQTYNLSSLLQSEKKFPGDFTPYYNYRINNNRLLALSKEGLFIYRVQ